MQQLYFVQHLFSISAQFLHNVHLTARLGNSFLYLLRAPLVWAVVAPDRKLVVSPVFSFA